MAGGFKLDILWMANGTLPLIRPTGLSYKMLNSITVKIIHQSLVLAAAIALPFALNAQSSSSGSSTSSSSADASSSSTQPRVSTGATGNTDHSGTTGSSTSDYRSTQSGMTGSNYSGMGSGQMMQVTKESLENKLTAKNLMDKDVYDRDQKKIGKVVDVVLRGQTGSLGSAFGDSSDAHGMGTSANSGRSDSASRSPGTANNTGYNGSQGSSTSYGSGSAMMNSSASQNSVVIAHGGLLKMNRDLISVPLSQLSYDSSSKHFMLNVSSSEISRVISDETASR